MSYAPLQWLGYVAVCVFGMSVGPRGNDLAALLSFAALVGVCVVWAWTHKANRRRN